MFNALYNIIIFPLSQLLEFAYQFMYEATGQKAFAVIGLSFVVTLCTLPLYMVAEGWQETERKTALRLKPGIDRIKKCFKGDEQYMILNTFYRQNHYNPIYALRSSLSLMIQIPFFLAAYHFLSELGSLKGVSFLFIKDFGNPDATFHIGNFAVNLLPIAMTLINCVSGAIYSKGHSVKEKIQIYAFAAIFLVVLYNSPAGLVVYWTMNNVLSLIKNIFYKLKNPKKVLYIILCIFAFLCLVSPFTILSGKKTSFRKVIFVLGLILPLIPFAVIRLAKIIDANFKILETNNKLRNTLFFTSSISFVLLAGLVIPGIIMESEPNNYCYVDSYKSPFVFMFSTFFQAAGFFLLWPGAFYGLFSVRIKKILTVLFSTGVFIAVINCFIFGGHYGPVEPWLEFMQPQVFKPSLSQFALNTFVIAAVFVAGIFILSKFPKNFSSCIFVLVFALGILSFKNIFAINKAYKNLSVPSYNNKLDPIFSLSKTNKNVIVIMQDRCFNPFVPYVFDEIKGLDEKFDGFTVYPNTISMGKLTMIGAPGLFGGYDYTPYRMNQRASEEAEKTLQDKHNEALLTIPLMFTRENYRAYVANLPYENYLEQPEYKMYLDNSNLKRNGFNVEEYSDPTVNPYTVKYEGHEKIQHNAVLGTYTNYWYHQHGMEKEPYISSQIFRNFIWFAFFKMVPPVLRGGIYHSDYWMANNKWDDSARFVDSYSVIDYLSELTSIDSDKGSLILLDNEATHDPVLLQAPEYDFRKPTDLTDIGNSPLRENTEFSTMCGIFSRYTEFFQYLKDNGLYDNTKIIIVSDHGTGYKGKATENLKDRKDFPFQKCYFAATLIVKDFNEHGKLKTDNTFMTNADTAYLAAYGVLKDTTHPFTGKDVKVTDKEKYTILNTASAQSTRIRKEKKFSVEDSQWYHVKDNIFDDANWSQYNK